MERIQAPFVGGELYFDDLERAKRFYIGTMALRFPMSRLGTIPGSMVVLVFYALNERGLSPTPRRIRQSFSLRYQT